MTQGPGDEAENFASCETTPWSNKIIAAAPKSTYSVSEPGVTRITGCT